MTMAFKQVASLDADTTISIGGKNKKTNKTNPTSLEGYFLGSKKVADQKKKSGFSYIHIFQTPKGNVGVWGKILQVPPGTMTRVSFATMRSTPNGDMYVYNVEIDTDNVVEAPLAQEAQSNDDDGGTYDASGDDGQDAAQEEEEEQEAPEAIAPPVNARAAADKQARVQALLNKKR
jgi:hypothetical protein